MARYNNYLKSLKCMSPEKAKPLYNMIKSKPGLEKLTGVQCAAVAELIFHQHIVGCDDGWDGLFKFYGL